MPDGRRVRHRAAPLGDRQGVEGPAARAVRLITFITRDGCTLCAEAQPAVERVAASAGVGLEVLDVDADPGLAQWSDHVPVVLLDGVLHSRWWVDEEALRAAL